MNHLKPFLLTIDDDAFQFEDDSFLLLGPTILSKLLLRLLPRLSPLLSRLLSCLSVIITF